MKRPKNGSDEPEKRRPILADRFLHGRRLDKIGDIYHPKAYEQIRHGVRMAEKFVFDEDACRRVAEVVIKVPDLLVREHQFARAPYDLTWIEWPSWAYWERLREEHPDRYDGQGQWGKLNAADHTVGYLIEHGRINVVSAGTVDEPDGPAFLCPIQYRLHHEWPIDEQLEFARVAGCSRLGLDMIMWGSTYDQLGMEERRVLRDHNVMEFVPWKTDHPLFTRLTADNGMQSHIRGMVGDPRTVIALLLMLNRPGLTQYVKTLPNTRGFIRGKSVAYMKHTTVHVSLDPVPMVRRIGTSQDVADCRRRHRVRGHFCHNKTARDFARIAGCIHEFRPTRGPEEKWTPWPDAPMDEVDNWVCAVCEGRRWWVDDHHRGTAEIGFVSHDGYEVTE